MAHWTDGPEYAPLERPDVFVEPEDLGPRIDPAEPVAEPSAPAAAPAAERPDYAAPDAAPLDAVPPPAAPTRDPREAFDVATTPLTSWSPPAALPPPEGEPVALEPPVGPSQSAWGAAHAPQGQGRLPAPPAWAPDQPFPQGAPPATSHLPGPPHDWPPAQVNPSGFPPAGPPPWQPPSPPGAYQPVTLTGMLRNATPGVLVCLALGAIIQPFALALLIVASVLASRVRYRRPLVTRLFSWAIFGCLGLGFLGVLGFQGTFEPLGWYDASTGWAQLASAVLFVAVPLVVGDAMRRGEQPEERL